MPPERWTPSSGGSSTRPAIPCWAPSPIPSLRRLIVINAGPWDRLDDDKPFVAGVGPRPPGAELYPHDMTKDEFEKAAAGDRGSGLRSLYTVVRRDSAGGLVAVPYHEVYADQVKLAAAKLRTAAAEADDPGLRRYLELRARALETDDYTPSDLAWLDMKNNTLDIVIGPIETYSDQLFGYKAAAESYVLIKDKEWSARLARYAELLPALQRGLPVDAAYKRERPGTDSDLNAYDAVYYAGEANAAARPSPSTFRTTSRCSSGRAPAACSSRTSCGPSSIASCLPSPTS